MSLLGGIARGMADVMTFGTNELAGNPVGKLVDQIFYPTDPNAAANAYTREQNERQYQLARENMAMEKEFAQNGISWRVADAAKNGISPLAALGASTPSYTPVASAFAPIAGDSPGLGQDLLSAGASSMGQGLARSLLTTQTADARKDAALTLAYKAKQNDLLDVQIAAAKLQLANHAMGPSMPLAYRTVMNRDGTTSVIPSEEAARAAHAESFGPLLWSIHNGMIPSVSEAGSGAWRALNVPDVRGYRMLEVERNQRNRP